MVEAENTSEQEQKQENGESFECEIAVTDLGSWKKKIAVTIPRSQIDKELDEQYGELRRTVDVPGFRRGHAPRKLFEKRYGDEITRQAKLRLLAQAFEKIDDEEDFEILGEPDLKIEDIEMPEEGDMTFEYEIEVKPEFELPNLEGIRIEKHLREITDQDVDDAINELLRREGGLEEVEQAEENDLVWADVSMQFEGAENPETASDVMIRVTDSYPVMGVMIEDVKNLLVGAKKGDERKCSASAPDTYEKEEYRGKKADISIKIKTIRRLKPAELTEEFLQKLGVADEAELRRTVMENLEDQVDYQTRQDMIQQVYRYLEDNIDFELPEGVVARYTNRIINREYYNLQRQGLSKEDIDENIEKLRASSSAQAVSGLKRSFIMERVAEELDIEVSDMELNGIIARMAAQQGMRPEKMRAELQQRNRLEDIKEQMREERAIEQILEMAEVVDEQQDGEDAVPAGDVEETVDAEALASDSEGEKSEVSDLQEKYQPEEKPAGTKVTRKEVKRTPPSTDKE